MDKAWWSEHAQNSSRRAARWCEHDAVDSCGRAEGEREGGRGEVESTGNYTKACISRGPRKEGSCKARSRENPSARCQYHFELLNTEEFGQEALEQDGADL